MKQESSDFFFKRPSFYFGSSQEMENEMQQAELDDFLFPFMLNLSYEQKNHHPTGLYLHWIDSESSFSDEGYPEES